MDNPIQTPKQSENISAKANKATNNTDKADKETTPNVKSSAIENKNTQNLIQHQLLIHKIMLKIHLKTTMF